MQITIVQAVVISIWIGLVMSRSFLGGATTTLRFTPMMTGLIVGLVFGRVAEAMIITAAIQLIYMGSFLREVRCPPSLPLPQPLLYRWHCLEI